MLVVRKALLTIMVLPLLACPGARPADEPSGEVRTEQADGDEVRATIVSDVDYSLRVYVDSDVDTAFLGSVVPRSRQSFTIPRGVLAARSQIRLRAEPVGPRGRYVSDRIMVQPGDVVQWRVFGQPR